MAAPLPTGFRLSVLPQAPNIGDPRNFAMDTQGALASQRAGLLLGQEMANLENVAATRKLESEKIKLAAQQNKLQMMQADEAIEMAPELARLALQAQNATLKNQLELARMGPLSGPGALANATAQGNFWGGMGTSVPGSPPSFSSSGSMVPPPDGVLTNQEVAARVMNTPGMQVKIAEREALRRSTVDTEQEVSADKAAQEEARKGLEPFSALVNLQELGVVDPKGRYDPEKARELKLKLSKEFPIEAKIITSEQAINIRRAMRAERLLAEAPAALDKLKDPGVIDSILNFMPEPGKAKTLFQNARDTLAARNVSPGLVERNALLDVLNTQIQAVYSGSTRAGAGVTAGRFALLNVQDTNAAIKRILQSNHAEAKQHVSDLLDGTGHAEVVRKFIEKPDTVRARYEGETYVRRKEPLTAADFPDIVKDKIPLRTIFKGVDGTDYEVIDYNGRRGWYPVKSPKTK